jgi:hypothetical protein
MANHWCDHHQGEGEVAVVHAITSCKEQEVEVNRPALYPEELWCLLSPEDKVKVVAEFPRLSKPRLRPCSDNVKYISSLHADRRAVTRNSDCLTDRSGSKQRNKGDGPYGGGTSAGRSLRERRPGRCQRTLCRGSRRVPKVGANVGACSLCSWESDPALES